MNVLSLIPLGGSSAIAEDVFALLPEIEARAEETEAKSAVPLDLLQRLERAGAFRMCAPARFGGAELPLDEVVRVIEAVAKADASTAWHLMIAAGAQIILSRLPLETARIFYADGPDAWPKAAATPKGVGIPVQGGYRLSGRWALASGAREYEWVSLGFFVKDGAGMLMAPGGKMPDFRVCLVPKDGVEVIETWDAVGLRGTRSDDLICKDLFVPEAAQASLFGPSTMKGPSLGIRMPYATGPHHTAVALGILGGALEDLAKAALTSQPTGAPDMLMKDDPVFRSRFGALAGRFEALRALAAANVALLNKCDQEDRDVTALEGARLSAAVSVVEHGAVAIMDEIMSLSGTAAMYADNRLQRRWRDLRCAAQHQAANIGNYGNLAVALIEAEGAG